MIDITNEVLTKLKTELSSVDVVTDDQDANSFPRLIFTETANNTHLESVDSLGENKAELAFDINIYTNGDRKMSIAKSIRDSVDDIMSGEYNMSRTFAGHIANYFDRRIYRYTLRYTCVVDKNDVIYRR